MEWVYKTENLNFLVHIIADIILFYIIFQYIRSLYHQTEDMIHSKKKNINRIITQYGFKK